MRGGNSGSERNGCREAPSAATPSVAAASAAGWEGTRTQGDNGSTHRAALDAQMMAGSTTRGEGA